MDKQKQLQQQLSDLFDAQNLAVLATQQAGQPYASLVAFVATEDLRYIYFVTPNTTRKYANLIGDKRVAILINSSVNQAADFHEAISVTAVGEAAEVANDNKKAILKKYLSKHPHLEDFVHAPTSALVQITVKSYYRVKNFQNVMELHLDR